MTTTHHSHHTAATHSRSSRRWLLTAGMAVATLILGLAAPASAGVEPEPFNLHPVGGGHWQARAGLADRTGTAAQGLEFDGDVASGQAHTIAVISGFEGTELSSLPALGFATNALPGGIITPCVKVGYESDGRVAHFLVGLDAMRATRQAVGPGGQFTVYRYDGELPSGAIVSVELEAVGTDGMLAQPLVLDDIVVGDETWSSAADSSAA